jgi:D-alanyl-D-alanine carboxypeptidase/D-alanyl-D-alanine-endopeptidase (penicillin-binding protein 4)
MNPGSALRPPDPKRSCRLHALGLLVILALAPACAARYVDPLTPPPVVHARAREVRSLQRDLADLFADPILARGTVAVVVQSLDRGDTLFRHHGDRLLMPASNMKLVTLAAAAEGLGWDHAFETTIDTTAPVADGVVAGDLVIRGSGDPTLNVRQHQADRVFEQWAETLWAAGLRRVDGRLVGDDNAFDEETLGAGWAWDNLPYGYAAPIGALQVNEDTVEVVVTPADAVGRPAVLSSPPKAGGVLVTNAVTTGEPGSGASIALSRSPGSPVTVVRGSIAAGHAPLRRTIAVDNPTLYFLRLFAEALVRRGIAVTGIADIDEIGSEAAAPVVRLLTHRSPPLRETAAVLMKASQNLYAETLLRALAEPGRPATAAAGRARALETLARLGVPSDSVIVADGSGLSRYNYVTADALAVVLRRMHEDPRHREPWLQALPVAGKDGTLERRFKGMRSEGRLRAKTGSISYVRALSGYVPAEGGETLAFVMLVNNVTAPGRDVDAVIDRAVERLMAFKR